MKRILTVAAATVALLLPAATAHATVRKPAPRPPAAVTITALTETCGAGGYTTITADFAINAPGTYDVSAWGDSVYQSPGWVDEIDGLAGQTYEGVYALSYPQQIDVVVTNALTGVRVAERAVGAPLTCTHGW